MSTAGCAWRLRCWRTNPRRLRWSPPRTPSNRVFKHLELIGTHGRQVLMVLVLSGGEVRQQMLTLAEPVTQEQLSAGGAAH